MNPAIRTDATTLLQRAQANDKVARTQLMGMVYDDLRALAKSLLHAQRPGHTLQPTALVHEAYLKLIDGDRACYNCRAHFFDVAAKAMRHVLVDHARARAALRRGGPGAGRGRVPLDVLEAARTAEPEQLLELDDALTRLEAIDARAAEVVRLRFYAGLPLAQIAELNNVTDRTVKRDWDFARGCMRTYKILKARAEAFDADPAVREIIAEMHDAEIDPLLAGYTSERAAALSALSIDIDDIARRGLRYERLDQLMMEHLLGARLGA